MFIVGLVGGDGVASPLLGRIVSLLSMSFKETGTEIQSSDVYMDSINRKMSIEMLVSLSKPLRRRKSGSNIYDALR